MRGQGCWSHPAHKGLGPESAWPSLVPGLHVGPAKPELGALATSPVRSLSPGSGLEDSCQGSSGASWPDRRPPSPPTSLPLLGWAPAPGFQHLGPNQTSFENCRCRFPATLKVLLKASLFEAGQVKPQPLPGLNYPWPGPAPSWPFKPPHTLPASPVSWEGQAVRVRTRSRDWQGGWGQQLGNGNRGWGRDLPGGLGCPSLKANGGKGVPWGLGADRAGPWA